MLSLLPLPEELLSSFEAESFPDSFGDSLVLSLLLSSDFVVVSSSELSSVVFSVLASVSFFLLSLVASVITTASLLLSEAASVAFKFGKEKPAIFLKNKKQTTIATIASDKAKSSFRISPIKLASSSTCCSLLLFLL